MEFDKLATTASHEAGAEVNILSPVDGSKTDVFIKIQGADSKAWRKEKKRQTSKIIAAKAEGKLDELDFDAMDVASLIAITLDWKGITNRGKKYECTPENAQALYEQSPSIVEQLLRFLGDSANFTQG
jgi:hypothetical protein